MAYNRIKRQIRKTPLEHSAYFSRESDADVYLKFESEQLTGSNKARGAFNKVLKETKKMKSKNEDKKIFAASCGNHGLAMTCALKQVGKKVTVYVPTDVRKGKFDALLLHGAEVHKCGDDIAESEEAAIKAARLNDGIYVSPYGDDDVIAGQGTIAHEILQDLENVDAIFVTVGGGGLISGISSYVKHKNPNIEIVGCSTANSNAMEQSVRAGKVVEIINKETIADGAAGNIGLDSITLPYCQRNIDRWVNVSESEISEAMYLMLDIHHKVIEGASGVALGAFLKVKDDYKNKRVVVLICGSGVGVDTIQKVLKDRIIPSQYYFETLADKRVASGHDNN